MPEQEKPKTEFWGGVQEATDMIYGKRAEAPNFAQKFIYQVEDVVIAALRGMWSQLFVRGGEVIKELWAGVKPELTRTEDETWNGILKWIQDAGILPAVQAEQLLRFRNLPFGVNTGFNAVMLIVWLAQYVKGAAEVSLTPTMQNLAAQVRPNLPDPGSMIQAAFIAPEKTGEVRDILKKLGYQDKHIDLMFLAQYQLQDVNTLMTLYLRKILTKEETYNRLHELHLTDKRIEEIMATWEIIPGPQDLLMMVAKEAFEPDMIERYGLGAEFPETQSEWLAKQGLTRFWQEKYWYAHWDYPGPGQVLDLMHRGLITREEVYEYYRVIEMPPYWRDKLMQASYNVYTRVDTRRMHEMGVLSDEELIQAYMDQGYDAAKAGKMAEFTKRYNVDNDKKLSMAQITKAYRGNMITRDDALAFLQILKYNVDQADWLLSQADFEEALELQNMYVSAAKDRYLDGIWDEIDARSALGKLNLPGARVDALIAKWQPARITDRKLPSKTDLDKFFKSKIIDADTYKLEMYKLGYNYQYTDWYMQVAKK